jgi:hypothetical protein
MLMGIGELEGQSLIFLREHRHLFLVAADLQF